MALERNKLVVQGTLLKKSEVEAISPSFKIKRFYLDCSYFNQMTGELIENIHQYQVINNKIDKLDLIPDKSLIKVAIDIRGKMVDRKDGTGKVHITTLTAYDFEIVKYPENTPTVQAVPVPASTIQATQPAPAQNDITDDLPF